MGDQLKWLVIDERGKTGRRRKPGIKIGLYNYRRRAFQSLGLDDSRFPEPEIRGCFHPRYVVADGVSIIGYEDPDSEITTYDIPVGTAAA